MTSTRMFRIIHPNCDIYGPIDHGRRRMTAASEQIRGSDRVCVQELTEDHARTPERFAPRTPKLRAVFSFDVPRKQS